MAISGLILVAACQGGSPGSLAVRTRRAAAATVTITIGNLTFTSLPAIPRGRGSAVTRSVANAAVPGSVQSVAGTGSAAGRSAATALVDRRPDLGIHVSVTGGRLASVVAVSVGGAAARRDAAAPPSTGGAAPQGGAAGQGAAAGNTAAGPGTAVSRAGRVVRGTMGTGATTWHSDWALAPAQAYRVTVTAVNPDGRRTVTAGTFRTLTPHRTFSAWTSIAPGEVFGVGMPIMVTFSRPITDKAEVERALEVWSSKPVTGAWYWLSDTEAWFRTRTYWPAHTQVRLEAHLKGVQGAPGIYGEANLGQHFRIGNSLVAVASAANHHMKVWWNGHLKADWPISTGQPGDDTPNGHYLSFSMGNPVDMNSATYGVMPGDPGYYNVEVYDSVKFTYSGDYVHSAPWSVGEQGFSNVSHGCVNVAPAQAAWYYDHSMIGDPITVVGSVLKGTWGDGWTIWFLPWRKLLAGSATGKALMANSHGSQLVPPRLAMPSSMHVGSVGP